MGKWLWIGVWVIIVGGTIGGVVHAQDPLWTCDGGQHDALLTAQAAYDAGDYATALNLASIALNVCEPASLHWQRAYDLQRRASHPPSPPPTVAPFDSVRYEQAQAAFAQADFAEAVTLFEQLLPTATDPAIERAIEQALADTYLALGDADAALPHYEAALVLAQTLNDPASAARILHSFATIYERQGRYREAASAFAAEASAWQAAANDRTALTARLDAARLYRGVGMYEAAAAQLEAALPTLEPLGQQNRVMDMRLDLAINYWYVERYAEAIAALQPALAYAEQQQRPEYQTLLLTTLAGIYLNQGAIEEALGVMQEAISIAEANPSANINTVSIYYQLGWVYRHLEDYPAAIDALNTALDLTRRANAADGQMILLRDIGLMYAFQGQYAEAITYYEPALDIARTLGDSAAEDDLAALIEEATRLGEQ